MTDGVRDNPEQNRFELDAEGHTALAYYRLSPGTITFVHTEVAPEVSGRGIGTRLVAGALDIVRARGLKVVSRCSFVSAFLAAHPAYRDLLA
ncbi:MAG: GNAT family N-acetyltransferase [Pseudorhodoplanes sp.]